MRPSLALAAVAAALPCLPAQNVTATATAQGVSGAVQQGGGQPIVRQVPAGTPLVGSGITLVAPGVDLAIAILVGTLQVTNTRVELSLTETLLARNQSSASLQGDVLLDVSSPVPSRARVELEMVATIVAGTPLPSVTADIGNNGSVNLFGAMNRVVSATVTLGGSTQILLRTSGSAAGGGAQQQSNLRVMLRVLPDSLAIDATPVLPACTNGHQLVAEETFAPGLQLRTSLSPSTPAVLVAGFAAAFVPVPGFVNCFLVPNPEAVALLPNYPPVAIPASFGPASFYLQSLALPPSSVQRLAVSNSLYVQLR